MTDIAPTTITDPLAGLELESAELLLRRRQWIEDYRQNRGGTTALRVLIGSNSLGCGGAEHQILRIMPHLQELGVEVEHFYYGGPHFLRPRFAERQLVTHFLDRNALGQWRFWPQAVSLIRQGNFDVVHAFNGTANFYVRGAAALAGVPVIIGGWRNRPMGGGLKFRMPLSLLNLVSKAWVINAATNTEALSGLWGMGKLSTYVAANGLDFEDRDYTVAEPLTEDVRRWVDGRTIAGAVGTISLQKNFDLFLSVAKRLEHHSERSCFCLVGGAEARSHDLEQHLRRRIVEEKLSGYVRMLGNSENVAGLLPHFSVLLCTSDFEGCPNVVMEAMRARLPVVMTACCETKLLIEEGCSGHVVAVGDGRALGRRVNELLDDPDKSRRFGLRARQLAEKHFKATESAWLMARIYLAEWERVQQRPRASAGPLRTCRT